MGIGPLARQGGQDRGIHPAVEGVAHSKQCECPWLSNARLLRALNDPNLFTSMSEWADAASRDAEGQPQVSKRVSRRRRRSADEFVGGDYDEVVVVTRPGH